MKKREFNKTINACRNRAKTRLDARKVAALDDATKAGVTRYLVSRRGPVLVEFLPGNVDVEWLRACGYLHTTTGERSGFTFIHTAEHNIL